VNDDFWSVSSPQPPWYSLGRLFLIHCDQGFVLHLDSMELNTKGIAGSTQLCEDEMSLDDARKVMLDHLEEKGYSWQ
jgi:hypothetical protein